MFRDYCKICGISKDENSVSFFPLFNRNQDPDEIYYTKDGSMFFDHIFEEIYPDSNYPEYICEVCKMKLTEFNELREMAISTHKHITEMLKEGDVEGTESDGNPIKIELDSVSSKDNKANTKSIKFEAVLSDHEEEIVPIQFLDHDYVSNNDNKDCIETIEEYIETEAVADEEVPGLLDSNSRDDSIDSERNKTLRCKLCLIVFKDDSLLDDHMKGHPTCRICDRVFLKKKNLNIHVTTEHDTDTKQEEIEEFPLDITGDNDSPHNRSESESDLYIIDGYRCSICNVTYENKKELLQHLNHHIKTIADNDSAETFQCTICDRSYLYKRSLRAHLTKHIKNGNLGYGMVDNRNFVENKKKTVILVKEEKGVATHQCDICSRLYVHKSSLNIHLKHHMYGVPMKNGVSNTNEEPTELFQCEICFRSYFQERTLAIHMKTHTTAMSKPVSVPTEKFTCTLCGNVYKYNRSLTAHLVSHHGYEKRVSINNIRNPKVNDVPTDIDLKLPCPICKRTYRNIKYLNYHLNIHDPNKKKRRKPEKKFPCSICGKKFVSRAILSEHEFRHKDERPLQCDICLKHFKMNKDLDIHSRIHTGEKQFTCDVCGKSFYVNRQLKDHKESHTNIPLYECNICFRKLKTRITWEYHMVTVHKKAGRFRCGICSAVFGYKYTLLKHIRTHVKRGLITRNQAEDFVVKNS